MKPQVNRVFENTIEHTADGEVHRMTVEVNHSIVQIVQYDDSPMVGVSINGRIQQMHINDTTGYIERLAR